jgi:glutamate N-acetyltransferase/amino-acid N-acetyltransferase
VGNKRGVKEIAGGICCVAGVKAAAVRDAKYGVVLIDFAKQCNAVALFTSNAFKAAPVLVTQRNVRNGVRAIVANSGNANCATGGTGLRDAERMAEKAAAALGADKANIAVASTGIIGKYMNMELVEQLLAQCVPKLANAAEASDDAAKALMTTDTKMKSIAVESALRTGEAFRIGAIEKGAGMICPNLATMLCFIVTDAPMTRDALDAALRRASRFFNAIAVDNDMSTNDTLLLVSTGEAKYARDARFQKALDYACERMARKIVEDGEGATKFITVEITGAKNDKDAKAAARAVATSMLVKSAMFGNNPNWGRVAAAIGRSGARFDEKNVRIWISAAGQEALAFAGTAQQFDHAEMNKKMSGSREITIRVDLGAGKRKYTACASDLSFDYVKVNAEYN